MEKLVADQVAVDAVRRIGQRPVDDAGGNAVTAQQLPDGPRANGIGRALLLFYQSEAHQRLREAEIGKQIERLIRSGNDVTRGRIDAGLVRQLPGGHGGPHRRGLRRPKRREVHHRAAVEQTAEIRKPAAGRIRRDEIERRAVEQNHLHARARLRGRQLWRRPACAAAAWNRRRRGDTAARQATRRQHQPKHRRDDARGPAAGAPAAAQGPYKRPRTTTRRARHPSCAPRRRGRAPIETRQG